MAKRFTDTEKWKKPFLRNLKAPYKLLWFYICDECDHAGIWQVDIEVARLKIGEKISQQDAIKYFKDKIVVFDGGEKWFIPSFIEFQYGQLAENNRAHTKAIFLLKKFSLINDDLEIKPLASPLQGAKDMDMEQEEVKDMEEEQVKGQKKVLLFPFETDNFFDAWEGWRKYKKVQHSFTFKSVDTEQAALKELSELSNNNEEIAIQIIQKSIANGWKGLFTLKQNNNGSGTSTFKPSGSTLNAATKERLAAKFQSNTGNSEQQSD